MMRNAATGDLGAIATLWHKCWHDAHGELAPPAVVRQRVPAYFLDKAAANIAAIRLFERDGQLTGFHMTDGDELSQFYVAAPARGTGTAALMIADAESALRDAGNAEVWLTCAIGNHRAARFYEKSGWRRNGTITFHTETAEGSFPLTGWRYEKTLIGKS